MIKTLLKHWIYEMCIEQLFSAVAKNFSKSPNPNILNMLEVGRKYNVIYYNSDERIVAYCKSRVIAFVSTIDSSGADKLRVQISYTPTFQVYETESGAAFKKLVFLDVENIISITL